MICLQACIDSENLEDLSELSLNEELLNLKSPNGEMIAFDVQSLKAEAAYVISESYGVDKKFELTHIDYLDVNGKGYVATVYYCTEDGDEGSFIKLSGVEYKCVNAMKSVKFSFSNLEKTRSEGGGGTDVTITCIKTGACSCTGTCNCRPVSKVVNGVVTVGCGECDRCVTKFYYN